MSEHIDKVVQEFQTKLEEHERQARDLKRIINTLRQHAGLSPLYSDEDLEARTITTAIQSDQFYGQPLSKAVREILVIRKGAGQGPASVAEIYKTLLEGGYKFETSDEENAKRNLRISLTKNSAMFHKLPNNGKYGLLEWYPGVKEQKPKASATNGTASTTANAEPATAAKTTQEDDDNDDEDVEDDDSEKAASAN